MRHGFFDHTLLSRHPGESRDPGGTGTMIGFPRYYAAERSGAWPLGPGFRRDDEVREDPHAR
ncbi:hypothetical protein C0V82_21460 (plasmid) [Niveispirillum cyanobacteriorum]|uniref:Uncharacterized protein n=1 Tax=Niveispirillum cyanobacteriorum TaxID=1612173 RepID=A0A2K9NIQ9_9PROT|nr:hypothetical protein C0V82_21460 [Niveispirillum cyanobacteriorum]